MRDSIFNSYHTPLSLEDTARFILDKNLSLWRNDSGYDYNLEGYWKGNGGFPRQFTHLPDTYKLPSHPTFSNESMYYTGQPWAIDWLQNPWVTLSKEGIL